MIQLGHKVASALGVLGRTLGVRPKGLRIMLVHHLTEALLPSFGSLLDALQTRCSFINPDRLHINEESHADRSEILVTFDDGLLSHQRAAEIVLRPRGIRAIFFVPSGFIDTPSLESAHSFIRERLLLNGRKYNLSPGMMPMSWDGLCRLRDEGHVIGSHTRSHTRLSADVPEHQLREEILGDADRLEHMIGSPIEHFAYPFGDIESIAPPALALAFRRFRWIHSGLRGRNLVTRPDTVLSREPVDLSRPPGFAWFSLLGGLDLFYAKRRSRLATMVSESRSHQGRSA